MSGLFGTNGVRGVVNESLTADVALQLGKAIGRYFKGPIAVAVDTRVTADMVKSAVASGLLASGSIVLDLGILPMPALQHYVRTHDHVVGGVMITASHNDPEYNGVKCIFSDGMELGRAGESKIEEYYNSVIPCEPINKIGEVLEVTNASEYYLEALVERADVKRIRDAKLKVIVDCSNGAASVTTPKLLDKLGVTTITLNADPQGEHLRHSSEPTEENLSDIIALMKVTKMDLGIAQDLDGDRIVFISNTGKFISGDISLAIMAKYLLEKNKTGKVVTPVSTSCALEKVVKDNGGEIVYTAVGSPVVAKRMKAEGAIFGGEENGGMIFPDFQYCRDPGVAIIKMLECIIEHGPLQEQAEQIPVYHMAKRDILCPNEKKEPLYNYLKADCSDVIIDETDGLKIIFDDGWILARPSGTEEKFRIFSESNNEGVANVRADEFVEFAEEYLSKN